MTPRIDDGGNAFPGVIEVTETAGNGITMTSRVPVPGMSLRAWFAGQAISGIESSFSNTDNAVSPKRAADYAIRVADALIAGLKAVQP